MARSVLLLDTQIGSVLAKAGSTYDPVLEASHIARLQAAGGVLLDDSVFGGQAVLDLALADKKRGAQQVIATLLAAKLISLLQRIESVEDTAASNVLEVGKVTYCSGSVTDATLPDPTKSNGQVVMLVLRDAITVTIHPFASETINGAASFIAATQWQIYSFLCDGTNWVANPV